MTQDPRAATEPPAPIATSHAPGTRIDTPQGPRRVETLRPGDVVLTAEGGTLRVACVGAYRPPGTTGPLRLLLGLEPPIEGRPAHAVRGGHAVRIQPDDGRSAVPDPATALARLARLAGLLPPGQRSAAAPPARPFEAPLRPRDPRTITWH